MNINTLAFKWSNITWPERYRNYYCMEIDRDPYKIFVMSAYPERLIIYTKLLKMVPFQPPTIPINYTYRQKHYTLNFVVI